MLEFFAAFCTFLGCLGIVVLLKDREKKDLSLEARLEELRQGSTTAYDDILLSQSASKRWVKPMLRSFAKVTRLLPSFRSAEVRAKLDNAGMRETEEDFFLGVALIVAFSTAIFSYILATQTDYAGAALFIMVIGFLVGFYLPNVFLSLKSSGRRTKIKKELPEFLDLLGIPMEAGEGFDQALMRTARLMKNSPLAEELRVVIVEINSLGRDRKEVWREAGKRMKVEALSDFISAYLTGQEQGISVKEILNTQSERLRDKRISAAEAAGATAPMKMAPAIVICFLPAILIMALGPLIIPAISKGGLF